MIYRISAFILISLLGLIIYSNTFNVPFQYDDHIRIVGDAEVQIERLGLRETGALLRKDRPLAMITFALNHRFGGLDVYGYHLVNVIIHILAAFGLFLFTELTLSILAKDPAPEGEGGFSRQEILITSLLASLLWLTNPLQTQAVTYIVQRMAGMAAMFYIFSIYFYAKWRLASGKRRSTYLLLCVMTALLAFGSKENSVTLPIFIFLYEVCIFRKGDTGFVKKKAFYLPVSLIALFLVVIIAGKFKDPESFFSTYYPYRGIDYVIKERFFLAARVFFNYISLFFFPLPSRLNIEHDIRLSRGFFSPPETALAVVGVVVLAAYFLVSIRRRPLLSFLGLWVLVNIAAESLYTAIGVMYEHRTYLPFMALSVMLARTVVYAGRRWERWYLLPAIIMIISFASNTYSRNLVWRDGVTLWTDSVKKSPFSFMARRELGIALLAADRKMEAVEELEKAKKLNPRDPVIRYYLGAAFFALKEYDKAVDEFRAVWRRGFEAPEGKPPVEEFYLAMAMPLLAHKDPEKGRKFLLEARSFSPDNKQVRELVEKLEKNELTPEDLMGGGW